MLPPVVNHRADSLKCLFAAHFQLYFQVEIRRRKEYVQPGCGCRFQSLDSRVYIFLPCTRERRYGHGAHFLSHFLDRFQVASRRNGEARFNHVHVQGRKLARQANLLLGVHREARRLFAVTERSVKDAYDVHRVLHALVTHGSHPAVQFIFILLLIISPYTACRRNAPWISENCRHF